MSRKLPSGYFMLEVVLALVVAALVMRGVFSLASGALSVSSTIEEEGRTQVTQEAFLNFMARNFEQLPGNTVMNLRSWEAPSQYLSELTFQNVPTAFSWSGQTISAEAIQLATVETANNRLNIVLRYYEEAILDDEDSTGDARAEPVAELILLRDVYQFEWLVTDGRSGDESYEWDVRGRMPLQLRLDVRFSPNDDLLIHHFWIPPKANPTTVMRNLLRGNRATPPATRGANPNNSADRTRGGRNVGGTDPRGGTP